MKLFVFLISSLIFISGCGSITLPPKTFEEPPLITQIRARVGVYYTGSARRQTCITPLFKVKFGEISVSHFDQIFPLMFSETIKIPNWPPWREGGLDVDAVIELRKAELKVNLGDDISKSDSVNINYQICMFKPDASIVNCWDIRINKNYQRKPFDFECLDLSDCFTRYIEGAVREAIAKFMLEFEHDSSAHEWSNSLVVQPTDS